MIGNNKQESGQAIAEMCIGLIAIMVVFLGVIFIAGLSISNVQVFVESKNSAEENAHDGTQAGAGENIQDWNYGSDGFPFTADDTKNIIGDNNGGSQFVANLTEENDSTGVISIGVNETRYQFIPSVLTYTKDYSNSKFNFTSSDFTKFFIHAAGLVEGDISNGYEVENDENIYDVEQLKDNFSNLIHVNLDSIDLEEMNKVYMPQIPVSE